MPRAKINYPIGSVSSGTMRPEDLIPAFCSELEYRAKHDTWIPAKVRRAHLAAVRDINASMQTHGETDGYDAKGEYHYDAGDYYESEDAESDLESLFDALEAYAGPYFYFGAHPGDGADYGYWLSESWDEDFTSPLCPICGEGTSVQIKVNDLTDVPNRFRGEVAVVNDHGNVTLYVKTARTMREVWSIV